MTGVILRHGYLVAEWGEPERVDLTFSVTKSFLSTTVGLAVDRGMIGSLRDPVKRYRAIIGQTDTGAVLEGSTKYQRLAQTVGVPRHSH
jgi:CubicO group peptidase (beta-lactamase class C family)